MISHQIYYKRGGIVTMPFHFALPVIVAIFGNTSCFSYTPASVVIAQQTLGFEAKILRLCLYNIVISQNQETV